MGEFELCHCGKPLHYLNPKVEALVRAMVQELGPTVPVVVDDHTWLVPRHFIALHGLRAQDLPALGFQELKKCPK